MPEEINRVLTDQFSALLYTTERSAHANLAREGISEDRVHFVGNLMIDSLLWRCRRPSRRRTCSVDGLETEWARKKPGYAAVTLHRPSNVDDAAALSKHCCIAGRGGEAHAGDLANASAHTGEHREIRLAGSDRCTTDRLSAAAGLSGDGRPDARRSRWC